jgi:excisionase family DNA binding protein
MDTLQHMGITIDEPQSLLTVREVAHRLGVSRHTLYRAIAAGHLRGVRLGGSPSAPIRIYASDLERFLRPTRELA